MILVSAVGLAQTGTVTGVIDDEDGEHVVGASVLIEGEAVGAATDVSGKYSIKLEPGTYDMKVFFVGFEDYSTKVTVVAGKTTVKDITLRPSSSDIGKVVAIGYGTKVKKDVTGSVASVKGKEVAGLPTPSFEAGLQGKVTGVQVVVGSGLAGSPSLIRIRGVASISASGDPLYIIDGVPVNQDYFNRGNNGAMNQNPLASINPLDIESIEILKDAAATAIYGARGSNGVIIITTKRAKKNGWNFEYNMRLATANPTFVPDMLTGPEWLQMNQEAWENDGGVGRAPLPAGKSWEQAMNTNTNWVDETIRTGFKQMYSISTGYKTDKWGAYLVLTHDDNEGYLKDNKYLRQSARLNVDWEPINDLKFKLSSSYVKGTNFRVYNGWAGGIGQAMSTALPIYPIYDSTGTEYDLTHPNPVAWRNLVDWKTIEDRSISSVNVEYKVNDKLSFNAFAGIDYSRVKDDVHIDGKLMQVDHAGETRRDQVVNNSKTYNARVNYKVFDNKVHVINTMLGVERIFATERNRFFFMDSVDQAFYRDEAMIEQSDKGIATGSPWALNSVFFRADYTYMKKYLVDVTVRTDGSSRFGPNNRYGYFPALGAGWIITEEPFMRKYPKINFLKLKTGIGVSGNVPSDKNAYRQVWIGSGNNITYNKEPTAYPVNHENPNLKWETSRILDISLEGGLFKNRIAFELAYYNKKTSDILLQLATPASTGFGSYWQNTGEFLNYGVEFSITSRNIVTEDFLWETQFNISRNWNKVLDLGVYFQDALSGGTNDTRVVVGEPLGTNYLVKFSHVDPQTGRPVYLDKDGNETYTWSNDDRVAVGSVLPIAVGGLNNRIRWKQFYLTADIVYKIGGNIYNSSGKRQNGVVTDWNMTTDYFDRWQQPGDDAQYPRLSRETDSYGLPPDPFQYNTTLFLEDGSYARLRNINLAYTLPKKWLSKTKIRRVEVGVGAFNILTWTNFSGGDPEIARDFENVQDRNMSSNISYLTAPQEKSIVFSLNVTL